MATTVEFIDFKSIRLGTLADKHTFSYPLPQFSRRFVHENLTLANDLEFILQGDAKIMPWFIIGIIVTIYWNLRYYVLPIIEDDVNQMTISNNDAISSAFSMVLVNMSTCVSNFLPYVGIENFQFMVDSRKHDSSNISTEKI